MPTSDPSKDEHLLSTEERDQLVREGIEKSQNELHFYILRIYPNHGATEDILQETNSVIWSKREEFRADSNFMAWAKTIAKFQTLSYLKSRNHKSWLHFDSELVRELAYQVEELDALQAHREAQLRECLKSLNEKDSELVFRRYVQKQSLREISQETGRSEGGLKQAFMRIRQILRICIQRKTASE